MATKVKGTKGEAPVRKRRNGRTRVSSKNQVTLPVAALVAAGIEPGDELSVMADGGGRLVLLLEEDVIEKYAGFLTGVFEPGYLEKLRAEWDRPWDEN